MKRTWQILSLALLLGAPPLRGQDAPPKKAVVIPEGLGAPSSAPNLPESLDSQNPEPKAGLPAAASLSREGGQGADVQVKVESKPLELVPSKRLPQAKPPSVNLTAPPKEAPNDDVQAPQATPLALMPAEGIVMEKNGTMVTLIGQVGKPSHYVLPSHAYLVDISGGGLKGTDAIGVGDFVALIGPEHGTGRVLFAHLPMGRQASENFEELDEIIKACYERAVKHLEDNSGGEGSAGGEDLSKE